MSRALCAGVLANGFPDGSYRPEDDVSRAQMAAFLHRVLDG